MHRLRFALLAAASALILLTAAPGLASAATFDVTVHPGDSIQAAIDGAPAGSRIHVLEGTYTENLLIRKPVTLVGTRAVLKPPASPTANACNQGGVVTGICVLGHFDSSFNLVSRVHDVTIRGFAIAQFSGDGIFAFGARRFTAAHDVFRNNGGYGVFALNSIRTTYRGNTSHDNGDAGFYVGESPDANAVIVNNTSYNNTGEGILFRDSRVADIHGNVLFGNCVGILVLDTGVPGRAGFASIHDNVVANNNRLCPADSDHPAFGGIGIGLAGARFTGVHNNTVAGNHNRSDSAIHGGGLVLITAHPFGGANPVGNRLTFNHLVNDTPRVFWDHTGRNNVIAHNS